MGLYQGNFAIFTAKNVLGWRDKQEIEHSGGDKPIKHEEISDLEMAKRLVFMFAKAGSTIALRGIKDEDNNIKS